MIKDTTMPITVPPYDHQQHGYEFTLGLYGLLPSNLHSNGAALLMEMGTGKSLTSIGVAGTLYQCGYINRLLIVAPLSITTVWLEEFEKFAAFPYTLSVLDGNSAKKRRAIEEFSGNGLEVLVINYESAWRLEKELAAWQPDMIGRSQNQDPQHIGIQGHASTGSDGEISDAFDGNACHQ